MQIQQKNTQQKEQWCNKKSNQWNASEQQVKGLVFHYTFLSPILFWCQTNKQKAATKKKNTNCTHTQKQVSIIIACFRHYKYFLPSYRNKEGSCQLFWHSDYFRPHRSTENVRTSRIKELRSRNGLAV